MSHRSVITSLTLVPLVILAGCLDERATVLAPDDPEPELAVPPTVAFTMQGGSEGYPMPGEIRTGFIVGPDGTPMEVTYEIHDGLAIWDSDIVIGREGEIPSTPGELLNLPSPPNGLLVAARGVVRDLNSFRWTNGVVPYEVEAGNMTEINAAIALVEQATAGVTLVPRNGESDYVNFKGGSGCSSSVGKQGGKQNINLTGGCSTGNTAHEILHALGQFHEHTRCDRDTFVTIVIAQVDPTKTGNFTKKICSGGSQNAIDLFAYAEGSMMHYSANAFAIGSLPTIISLRGLDNLMGQRTQVGPTDIQTQNFMYGSNNQAPVADIATLAASYPEGSSVSFDGSASADPDDAVVTYAWTFGDGTCTVGTPPTVCSEMSPSHTYADDGSYSVSLTVSDDVTMDGGGDFKQHVANATATIVNVIPIVNAGADETVDSGDTYDFSGTFSDPGIIDHDWKWVINWGDGTPNSMGSTDDQSAAINASHQFCTAGSYMVALTVTDKDDGAGSDDLTITVPHIPVSISIKPNSNPSPMNLKSGGVIPVAILSSATFDALDVDPASVVLGDGVGADTPVNQRNNGTYQTLADDVDGDGLVDLVLYFRNQDLVGNGDLTDLSTELVLRGFLNDGCTNVRGFGPVGVRPS